MAHRQEIVDFAMQFEGNPYVYGGTSLTNGADCSGFMMSVFKEFGYELPRVAAAQYESSQKKELSDIEVGDLVFYGSNIYHVACISEMRKSFMPVPLHQGSKSLIMILKHRLVSELI